MRSRSFTMIVVVTAALVCSATGVAHAVAAPAPETVARSAFDGRSGAVLDKSGNGHTMTLVSSNGGSLTPVAHGAGLGLQFPATCSAATCPQAVLQTPSAPDLNPGTRPLSYGATIRLAPDQTTDG